MDLKILRLASDTKSQKKISDFTHNSKAKNPLCGDEIQLFFKVNKGKITKVSYQGKNCVISAYSKRTYCEIYSFRLITVRRNFTEH